MYISLCVYIHMRIQECEKTYLYIPIHIYKRTSGASTCLCNLSRCMQLKMQANLEPTVALRATQVAFPKLGAATLGHDCGRIDRTTVDSKN